MTFCIKIVFCFLIFFTQLIYGQNLPEKNKKAVPKEYNFYSYVENSETPNQELEQLLQSTISVQEFTIHFQKIIDDSNFIVLPNNSITIAETGIKVKSNKTIVFQENTVLKIEANGLENYGVISIIESENIKIINPKIIGDRYTHKNKKGEWGHGIHVLGSKNILIENFMISDCWGDGVYVGRSKNSISQNIEIRKGLAINNRRNGISITSVKGLNLEKVTAAFTNGINPQFGIDIEPNSHLDEIQEITIKNCITYNNANGGLAIGLNKLGLKSPNNKSVGIKIEDFEDYGSYYGLYIGNISSGAEKINGVLCLKKLKMYSNNHSIYIKSNHSPNFKILLSSFDILEPKNVNADKKNHLRTFRKRKDMELRIL